MQLKIKEFLKSSPEPIRAVKKKDLLLIMGEMKRRHTLPITPVTDVLLFKYLEVWYKRPFIMLKKRVNELSELSLRIDISHKLFFHQNQ
jgi:hypothetical protein